MKKRIIICFLMSFYCGCTAPSTMLLDEYISIKSDSGKLRKQANLLADHVNEKIVLGDSLINILEKSYKDSIDLSMTDYSKEVLEYIASCELIEKKSNALKYKFLDHNIDFSTFLKKASHSKHSKSLLKIKNLLDEKIESQIESIDEETLNMVKLTLLQHQQLLEAAIKLKKIESKLNQWEAQHSLGGEKYEDK